jgi:hypothetical protein
MTDGRSNNGGARPGAGRHEAGTLSIMFRLKRETVRLLARAVKRLPEDERWGAKSRIADEAIQNHLAANAAQNDRRRLPDA